MTIDGKSADAIVYMARRGCTSKWRYSTRGYARDACKRVEKRNPGRRMGFYECEFCGGWHLTTKR